MKRTVSSAVSASCSVSLNRVILVGNVGADPRMRHVDRIPVAEFSLATTDPAHAGPNGTMIPERTEWHNLVMWGDKAELAERYIRKGTKLYVEGRLRYRTWQDHNAIKRTVAEVAVEKVEILQRAASS